jgi:RNA polymerase sigma-70 factor (ECF subfamily)
VEDLPGRVSAPSTLQGIAPDEANLVAQARAGDFGAFERLIAAHEARLFALARHLVGPDEGPDVLQTGLLAALEALPRFRGESAFGTWLTRIVTNAGLKLLRTRRSRPAASLDALRGQDGEELPLPQFVADWREDPVRSVERAELRLLLDGAIAALPEHHRSVFVLRDVAGLNVAETAEALDLSQANVKVRLLRARLALRERLTRALGDERKRVTLPSHHDHAPRRPEVTP